PDQFQCEPGAPCFHREWLCDGHPDCIGGEDERDCEMVTTAEPSPEGLSPEDTQLTPVELSPEDTQWFSACSLSSPALLSILGAVGSVAMWGLSKAKSRSDILSPENGSREELMPDKSH
ncbi:RSVR protein, partial [Piaya cayana]|nr:RSVR protein [Piaya cayana]